MRVEGARRLLAAAAILSCSIPCMARAAPGAGAADSARADARADSARVGAPADTTSPADTTRPAGVTHPAGGAPPVWRAGAPAAPFSLAAPPALVAAAASAIDVAAERKLGAASLEDVLRMRRAVFVGALPLFGPTQGSLALPDGGGPIGLDGWTNEAERATDEPLIGSVALGWGAPWLPFVLNDPRADALEPLDLDAIDFPSERTGFRAPGETLTRPIPRGAAFARSPEDTAKSRISKTTLMYRRGDGDAQLTGVRFQTIAFRRGLYASFSRNQAHGRAPLKETVSKRYALRAELGRVGSHRLDLEALLYERSFVDSAGRPPYGGGESEWDRRQVFVRAARDGQRSSDALTVRLGTGKETWILSPDQNVSPDAGSRERWEFPVVSAEGSMSWRPTPALTWIASVTGSSRKIVYRLDSLPEFEPRRGEARAHLGSRYALSSAAGAGFDAAYDVRQTQTGFWDGRGSLWYATGRVHGRVDVESVHERPSWVDLLTPPRLLLFFSPDVFFPSELFRSGDSGLKPRRLTGPLGSVGFTPAPGVKVELSGSYRRVTDDFGWSVSADTTGGVLRVSSVARARGSGWLSHAGLGWEFRRGVFRTRGFGWIRGGPDSLSPQSGSPPRRAIDAAMDLRVVLFQGDLPLRFGIESHARGPRRGLIREAGVVTWDGTLSADFGTAGVFVRVQDAFDRRPGSAMWDPTETSGLPMPGRTFQAGVSWNLLD